MDYQHESTVSDLHHVGLVVRDMSAARRLYHRLGFTSPPAAFPALPREPGGSPEAFGAGNTHIEFGRAFVELATVVDVDRPPGDDDARLHPLEVAPDALPVLVETITATADRLRQSLERGEGAHILAFGAPDVDRVAARLDRTGIPHGGVQRFQRPTADPDSAPGAPVGYFELDDPANTPEGRLAIAEFVADGAPDHAHPNGAIALVEVEIWTAPADLSRVSERFSGYLDRVPRTDGPSLVFDLDSTRLVLTPASSAAAEHQPRISRYVVAVRDLDATRQHLVANEVPHSSAPDGGLLVDAADAIGCTIGFRQLARA